MGNLCCVYIICGNYGDILLVSFLFFVFFLLVIIKGCDVRFYIVYFDYDDFYIISIYYICIYLKKFLCLYCFFFIKKK